MWSPSRVLGEYIEDVFQSKSYCRSTGQMKMNYVYPFLFFSSFSDVSAMNE